MALHAALWMHAGLYRRRRLSSPPLLLVACLAVLVPPPPRLFCAAAPTSTVVTHLPGFDGPLPFYLETGYVEIEEETGAELFYYFAESERSPRSDPLLLWLTGGPRCSVLSALAFQIGPLKFVVEPYDGTLPRLVYNPYSWTQMASILFLDSPVGSGFSYARDPKAYEAGDISSSRQVLTFLRKWFDDHPKYLLDRPFYIGGDSYAGKVVPLIAHYISEAPGIEEIQQPIIKLKGYIVGNPVTGDKIDSNSRVTFSHSFGIISDQQYEAFVQNCKGDYLNPTNEPCADVVQTIDNLMSEVYVMNILQPICHIPSQKRRGALEGVSSLAEEHNHYQLSGAPDEPPFDCFYDYRYYLSYFWANDNAVGAALGVKEGTVAEWIRCKSPPILPYACDLPSSIKYFFNLSIRGYRGLVYSGDHDLVVPFSGTQAWTRSFNLSIVDDWRAWHLDNQAAGLSSLIHNHICYQPDVCDDKGWRPCFS